jgi:hypothetical protein
MTKLVRTIPVFEEAMYASTKTANPDVNVDTAA